MRSCIVTRPGTSWLPSLWDAFPIFENGESTVLLERVCKLVVGAVLIATMVKSFSRSQSVVMGYHPASLVLAQYKKRRFCRHSHMRRLLIVYINLCICNS